MKLSRFSLMLAFAGAPIAPVLAQTKPPAAIPAQPKTETPRAGELRLDGKLTAILGVGVWQVEAFSWTSPRGVTTDFEAVKTKNVFVAPTSLIHPRGEDEKIALRDVKLGTRVAVIGKNGADGTLQAREVVLLEGYGKVKTVGSVQINPISSALIGKAREAFDGGDQNKAIALTNSALKAAEAANDRPGQAFSLNDLGLIFLRTQQFERAKDAYQKSEAIWRNLGDDTSHAIALSGLASSFLALDDAKSALPFIQRALPLSQSVPQLNASVLNRLGSVYYALKMRDEALQTAETLVPIAQNLREWEDAAEASINVAELSALTDAPRARKSLARADELAKNITDEKVKANLNSSYAAVLWILGDKDAANARLESAAQVFEAAGDAKTATQIRASKEKWDADAPENPEPAGKPRLEDEPPVVEPPADEVPAADVPVEEVPGE